MITISGGEPLDSDIWLDVASYAKKKGLKVSLSTNGLNLNKFYTEVFEYVDNIQVSLGGTRDIIAEVRYPGIDYDRIIQNLMTISLIKQRKSQAKPYLRLIYVISEISYLKLVKFYNNFSKIVDDIYFQHLIYTDKQTIQEHAKFINNYPLYFQGFEHHPAQINIKFLAEQIQQLKTFKKARVCPELSRQELIQYYNPRQKYKIKRNCVNFMRQVDLYPNGELMTCPDIVLGNIKQKPFDEIWFGPTAKYWSKIRQYQEFPACKSCFYYYMQS
jgi:MoaA/NifB/PqqE/SkfB family radical SAM enzyme